MPDAVGTTHHLKIGDQLLLLYPNSYQKFAAPVFGARFSSGSPDYSNLSQWQHWPQECWIGGIGQETWDDDAMYDSGVGVDTTQHGVITLARDLGKGGTNYGVGGDTNRKRKFFFWDNKLHVANVGAATNGDIWRYATGTNTWTQWATFTGQDIGEVAKFSSDLYVATDSNFIKKFNGGAWSNVNKPTNRTHLTPQMMYPYRERLYCGFGRFIYRLKPNDTWDGTTEFFDGHGIDYYVSADYYNGFVWFLSNNGHIVRTDGDTVYDVFAWDGQTRGVSLKAYDGKLFVFTHEWTDADDDVGEGVIYQFGGSAVTELKRWGRNGRATSPGRATVANRKLFYGASDLLGLAETKRGFGIAAYDSVEDAHSIFASNRDNVTYADALGSGKSWQVDDIAYFGGYLWCSTRGHGLFRTKLETRDVSRYLATYDTTAAGAAAHAENAGWFISSDFDAGTPGLRKLWHTITVHVDLPNANCSVRVSYSIDGGITWVYLGTHTGDGVNTRFSNPLFLENIQSPRLKYKLQLEGTGTRTPQVRGVVVSFLPEPEPNWQWRMTVALAENIEKLDGVVVQQDIQEIREELEGYYRSQELIYFQDIDGTEWTNTGTPRRPGVRMSNYVFNAPYIGPTSEGPIEGTIQLELIEAVESYT